MNCYRKCTMIDWPNRKIMYKWYLHRSVPGSRIIESIIRWTASTIRFQGCSKQTRGCHQYVKSITVYQFVCINIKSHLSIIWLFDACLQMTVGRIVYAFWQLLICLISPTYSMPEINLSNMLKRPCVGFSRSTFQIRKCGRSF